VSAQIRFRLPPAEPHSRFHPEGGPRQAKRSGGQGGPVRRGRRGGIPDESKLDRLAGTRQPTLVTNGDNDAMIPTINTHILGEHLPSARVRIFPDAGHGFLFQWPVKFANVVGTFLAA
jgi:pimeloyl-ACP methyl ester carboxylesterase